jgi:hypothetical protein
MSVPQVRVKTNASQVLALSLVDLLNVIHGDLHCASYGPRRPRNVCFQARSASDNPLWRRVTTPAFFPLLGVRSSESAASLAQTCKWLARELH